MPKPFRIDRGQMDTAVAEATLKNMEDELASYEESLRRKPDRGNGQQLALLYNNLAWKLATGPLSIRNPARALDLAGRAVALTQDPAIYLNTLGVAQYRSNQFEEAIATLEKSLDASKGGSDAFHLFFLAMARYKLGEVERARADFDRGLKWRREHPKLPVQWTEDLDIIQPEAEALLNSPLPPLPANPFAPAQPSQES